MSNNIFYEKFDLIEYVLTKPTVANQMTLILKSSPEITQGFEFTVKYYQDGIDYDYFEFLSQNIVIVNW